MNEKLKYENESVVYIIIDLFFTFAPILYLIFLRLITHTWENIFIRSDISFISMILFGQSLIKFLKGLLKNKNKKKLHMIMFWFVLLVIIGFIPPIIFLTLLETNQGNKTIYILQIIWLFFGSFVYFLIGSVSNVLEEHFIKEADFIKKN